MRDTKPRLRTMPIGHTKDARTQRLLVRWKILVPRALEEILPAIYS